MCSLDLGCIGIMDGRLHGTSRMRYITFTTDGKVTFMLWNVGS